jgi:pilus assembly protein Flp/PilA
MLRKILNDTAGATAIEYALIASVISIAAVGAFIALGTQSRGKFEQVDAAYASTAH